MKPTDKIKKGYIAYHVMGGKIDDKLILAGLYIGKPCQLIIDDGWDFVSTRKYKVNQLNYHKIWPKSHLKVKERPENKIIDVPCIKCKLIGRACWPFLPYIIEKGCNIKIINIETR